MKTPIKGTCETYNGYPVVSRVEIPAIGSSRYNALTTAAAQWAKVDAPYYQWVSDEQIIERETGIIVHCRTRI